jgi:hypothetical protein
VVEGDKIQLEIDGRLVEGKIRHLYSNDMEVEITAPYQERHTGTPVPSFAMGPVTRLCAGDGPITERGIQRAEMLLRELYRLCLAGPDVATD